MEKRPEPDELLRYIQSSYEAARSLRSLEELQKNITLDPERREAWLKQLRNILQSAAAPVKYTIGVAGGTGAGKTTLLCALLGSSCLPISCSRAATAAVTKISYHEHQFLQAEVHFLSEADWREDISIAQQDIMSEIEKDVDHDAMKASLAKLQAVYPGLTKAQLLVATPDDLIQDLGNILQQPIIIKDMKSSQFVDKLTAFVATTSKPKERQLWPLVSYTQIFINSEVLKPGLTLVDLPGNGDSNAARNKVARDYLKNVDALWIVGRIQRITDDKATKDWIEMMAGRFFADGRSGSSAVTFIATHIDDIPSQPEHLCDKEIGKYNTLNHMYNETNELLKTVEYELERVRQVERPAATPRKRKSREYNSLSSSVKKRRGADHANPRLNEMRDSNEMRIKTEDSNSIEVSVLLGDNSLLDPKEKELHIKVAQFKACKDEIRREKGLLLTRARNKFVKTYIRSDFKQRIFANASVPETDKIEGVRDIPVICVASNAFHDLNSLGNNTSNASHVFQSDHETGIPSLRSHAITNTLKFCQGPAILLLQEVRALVQEISLYLQQKPVATTSSNREYIEGVNQALGVLKTDLRLIVSNSRKKYEDNIRDFRLQLEDALNHAEEKAPATMQELTICCKYYNTYRAVMRQTGERGNFDFNAALSKPILEKSFIFRGLFTDSLPLVLSQLHTDLLESVEDTLSRITVTADSPIGEEVLRAVAGARVHHLISGGERSSREIVQTFQRDLVDSFPKRVQEKLASHYKEVAQETGLGMLARMRRANIAYINEKRGEIFESLNVEIEKSLELLVIVTFAVIDKTMVEIAAKVTRAFEPLSTTLPSIPDSEVQHRQRLQKFLKKMLADTDNPQSRFSTLTGSIQSGSENLWDELEDIEDEDEDDSESDDDCEESMHDGLGAAEMEEIEDMLTRPE